MSDSPKPQNPGSHIDFWLKKNLEKRANGAAEKAKPANHNNQPLPVFFFVKYQSVSWLWQSNSEVVITSFIIVIRVVAQLAIFIAILFVIRLIILRLKSTFCLVLTLGAEASFGLAHLVEFSSVVVITVLFENLVFLVLQVLILQFLNHLLLLLATLAILQVVHIKLVFEVVNIGVLLDVCAVEALKLGLKSLILFLELRLDILDALKTLIGSFKLNTTSLDGVLQNSLVTAERLDRFLHLLHFARLRVNDIANAFLDILLLSVLIKVPAD